MEQDGENASRDFKLKGPRGWIHGLRNGLKGTFKNATDLAKIRRKKMYAAILAVALVFVKISLPLLLFFAAAHYVITTDSHNKLVSSVGAYFSNFSGANSTAKETFEETGSLLFATNEDIKNISNSYLNTLQRRNNSLFEIMSAKGNIGSEAISKVNYAKGFDISNAYEFILNSERMNFNRVSWKKFDRESGEITDLDLQVDSDTNLKYPKNDDDSSKDLSYFANMIRPYLQSYVIPSSMVSGIATKDDITGIADFAFQIIDKGYHEIDVLQYAIQTAKRDQIKKHYISENVTLTLYSNTVTTSSIDPKTGETKYTEVTSYGYDPAELENAKNKAKQDYATAHSNSTERIEISQETAKVITKDYVYPITKADTLRKTMKSEYSQIKYNENDVENFQKPDSKYVANTEELLDVSGLDDYVEANSNWTREGTISVSIESGEYITTRFSWSDELKSEYNEERNYEVNDVSEFVNKTDKIIDVEERELTEEEKQSSNRPDLRLKASQIFDSPEENYYLSLEKENDITRIDLINATPSIYKEYLRSDEEYSKYIGYSRPYLSMSYTLLNKHLSNENISIKYSQLVDQALGTNLIVGKIIGENFIWPLAETGSETITSCAGVRVDPKEDWKIGVHGAIDIAAPSGYKIRASQDGVIYKMQPNTDGYGNMIVIRHKEIDGVVYYTLYAHMNSYSGTNGLNLKKGDTVKAGQVIGYVGTTGRSTGNHLHFEIIAWPKNVNNGNYRYLSDYKYCLEPILYIQTDTIPDRIMSRQSLPENCGDIKPNNFGMYSKK